MTFLSKATSKWLHNLLLSIACNLHHLPVKVQPLIQIYNEYLSYNQQSTHSDVTHILMTPKTRRIICFTSKLPLDLLHLVIELSSPTHPIWIQAQAITVRQMLLLGGIGTELSSHRGRFLVWGKWQGFLSASSKRGWNTEGIFSAERRTEALVHSKSSLQSSLTVAVPLDNFVTVHQRRKKKKAGGETFRQVFIPCPEAMIPSHKDRFTASQLRHIPDKWCLTNDACWTRKHGIVVTKTTQITSQPNTEAVK